MENFEPINQTFHAIRQLPLEVSFSQVKKWVCELPATKYIKTPTPTPKTKWSFLKSLFPPISEN